MRTSRRKKHVIQHSDKGPREAQDEVHAQYRASALHHLRVTKTRTYVITVGVRGVQRDHRYISQLLAEASRVCIVRLLTWTGEQVTYRIEN